MVNWKSKSFGDFLLFANGLVLLLLINILSSEYFFRADLTEEKRYSIKKPTKELLRDLDEEVFIEVYLEGELNAPFRRFRNAIRETLEQFRIYSSNKVRYEFIDPATAISQKAQTEFMAGLASKGIQPTQVIDNKGGQRIEKLIFPGALVSYGGAESGIQLLKGNKAASSEEEINQSIEGVEFELANAIHKLSNDDPSSIGLVTGHGELDGLYIEAFRQSLLEIYDVQSVALTSKDISAFDALVIAKPTKEFSENEKFRLDQYIINGGAVLFLLDKLEANMDSASHEGYFAFPYDLNLEDLLFRYGARLNLDLIQDRSSGRYPVFIGQPGAKQQIKLMDWPFYPLINHYADHPMTSNLDAVVLHFASSIDTVKADGIRKTPLLFTSQYARTVSAPVMVSIDAIRKAVSAENFSQSFLPTAYLLEGRFTSLYKNRFLPEGENAKLFKDVGKPGKVIIVSDGDLARNVVNPRTQQPQPLGFDPVTNYTFANRDLLMNMVAYLADDDGLINVRNKEVKIRPLDKDKIANEKLKWQIINVAVPVMVIIVFGIVRSFLRKRRYANF